MKQFRAFTSKSNKGLSRNLVTPAQVRAGSILKLNAKDVKAVKCNALWDTGATNSVIGKKLAKELNLIPVTKVNSVGVSGPFVSNVYWIDLLMPHNVEVLSVKVTEGNFRDEDPQLLLGMDIITLGDFSITNVEGKTVFSFRNPSIKEVDYVKEMDRLNEKIEKAAEKAKQKAKRKNANKVRQKQRKKKKKK